MTVHELSYWLTTKAGAGADARPGLENTAFMPGDPAAPEFALQPPAGAYEGCPGVSLYSSAVSDRPLTLSSCCLRMLM
jgi:hypothetical protein